MITGKDIVVLALPRYDGPYESASVNIATELARHNRVILVDHPFNFTEVVRGHKTPQIRRRLGMFRPFASGLHEITRDGARMWVLTPPIMPPINALPDNMLYDVLSTIASWFVAWRIRSAIRRLGFRDWIYINSFDFYYQATADFLRPALKVYHCVDAMVKPYTLRHGPRLERKLLRKADLVITTSRALQEAKKQANPHTYYVPNAARIDVVRRAFDPKVQIPGSLRALRKPVIGYFGNIERRIDYDLILAVADARKDWHFAFVGPTERQWVPDGMFRRSNIHLLGRKPYSEIPGYLKGFDIATIPFKVDAVSRTIYPLKFYEYLGAGRPVVTTPFNPDLIDPLRDVVSVAATPEEYIAAVEHELANDSPEARAKRVAVAASNTWEARADAFGDILRAHLEGTANQLVTEETKP